MKISIIIPSFNQGQFIADALKSILGNAETLKAESLKEHPSVEVLVIDNCSNDKTAEAVQSAPTNREQAINQSTIPNLRFVSEPDRGQTDAINKGLAQATGDILAYLCADDFYEPGALAAVVDIFEKHPEVDVVYGDGYFLEGDSGWKRLKKTGPFSLQRLRHLNFIIQPACFWRRSVYEKFGPLDASLQYCMDNEYWLRIAPETRWHYLPRPLATARLHSDAKTSSHLVAAWEETAVMAARYGLGERYQSIARRMRLYGAKWYAAKRMLLRKLGKWA